MHFVVGSVGIFAATEIVRSSSENADSDKNNENSNKSDETIDTEENSEVASSSESALEPGSVPDHCNSAVAAL